MDRKIFIKALLAYFIWGAAPLYWHLLSQYHSLFTLADRIVFSSLFFAVLITLKKEWRLIQGALRDRAKMRYILLATIIIAVNWGVYIWAMVNGHVLDASMGYYFNPLMNAIAAIFLFRERPDKLQVIAFGLAGLGVLAATIEMGQVPLLALAISLSFCLYSCVKKKAALDPIVTTSLEAMLLAPLSLAYIFLAGTGAGGLAEIDGAGQVLLLMGAGLLTSVPLLLFAEGVNKLPLLTIGFMQYISPTITLFCGLLLGEELSPSRLLCFVIIWLGLAVFMVNEVKKERQRRLSL